MFPQLVIIQNVILIRNLPCPFLYSTQFSPLYFFSSRDGAGAPVSTTAGVLFGVDAGVGSGVVFAEAAVLFIAAIVAAASGRRGRGGPASPRPLQGLKASIVVVVVVVVVVRVVDDEFHHHYHHHRHHYQQQKNAERPFFVLRVIISNTRPFVQLFFCRFGKSLSIFVHIYITHLLPFAFISLEQKAT